MNQCMIYVSTKVKYCAQPRGVNQCSLFTLIVHYTKFQSMMIDPCSADSFPPEILYTVLDCYNINSFQDLQKLDTRNKYPV